MKLILAIFLLLTTFSVEAKKRKPASEGITHTRCILKSSSYPNSSDLRGTLKGNENPDALFNASSDSDRGFVFISGYSDKVSPSEVMERAKKQSGTFLGCSVEEFKTNLD